MNAIRSTLRRVYRKIVGKGRTVPVQMGWRTVEQGPLKGRSVYVPIQGSWGDDVVKDNYESEMLAALKKLASGGGALYDIGAHHGIYTVAWLCLGGCSVEAFDPVTWHVDLIRQVAERNGVAKSVHLHTCALANYDGQGRLRLIEKDTSRAYLTQADDGVSELVSVHRLDDLVQQQGLSPPAVVKMDVEGAEFEVLKGAQEVLETYHPALLIEVHTLRAGLEITDWLGKRGYELEILGMKGRRESLALCMWR